jgi:trigger factor
MNVTTKKISTTQYELTYNAGDEALKISKKHALNKLSKNVKIAGFRAGKAPEHLIEKSIDQALLQNEFVNEVVNHTLNEALTEADLRPVVQPQIEVTKFVPFTEVEIKATILVLGDIKLPEYKKLKTVKPEVKITNDDIDQVISNLKRHMAEKKIVDRKSQNGDQVWIDFEGKDDKGDIVNGASGKDYPLLLGSKSFIPGFEENLVGLKAEEEKSFIITFPKDYGVKAMQSKKVTFACRINKVQEIVEPELNNDLAKKANPALSTVDELKEDIKKQLTIEREKQAEQEFENALVLELVNATDVDIPDVVIEEQIANVMRDLNQNLIYRGQTYQEYLENSDLTEKEHREKELLPEAKRRLVAGIALSEIADKEKITVTPEELELRLQILKGQYASDPTMQQEIQTDEGRRTVAGRLLTEKTLAKLKSYAKS